MADNVVHMKRPPHKVLGIEEGAGRVDIDEAWIQKVRNYTPGRTYDGTREYYQEAMDAYIALTGELTGVRRTIDCMIDWAPYFITSKGWLVAQTRDGCSTVAGHMVDDMVKELDELPNFLPGERLYGLDGYDITVILDELLRLPEFSRDRNLPKEHSAFQIIWRNGNWRSKGAVLGGTCQAIPKKDKDLWTGEGKPPSWRLTLNLPYWALADEWERKRLVHHEVAHAMLEIPESDDGEKEALPKAKTIPHDLEEHICTAARFGVSGREQVRLIVAAYHHPETQRAIKEHGLEFNESGQGYFKMFHRGEIKTLTRADVRAQAQG